MSFFQGHNTALRVLTAFVWLPLVACTIWLPGLKIAYMVLILFLSAMGAFEFSRLVRAAGLDIQGSMLLVLTPMVVVTTGLDTHTTAPLHPALFVALFLMVLAHLGSTRQTIAGISASVFGLMYTGYCSSFFIALHKMPGIGPALVTFLIVTVGLSDTGAYAIGRRWGKHKLAPSISPNKTIEGSIAGICFAMIAAVCLYALKTHLLWTSYPNWPVSLYVFFALILSLVGQLGDLVESMLKRSAGVKDSGNLFPGHGGVLDRCDAFLFGGPVLYYIAYYGQL